MLLPTSISLSVCDVLTGHSACLYIMHVQTCVYVFASVLLLSCVCVYTSIYWQPNLVNVEFCLDSEFRTCHVVGYHGDHLV